MNALRLARPWAVTPVLVLLLGPPARADIINGGFEAGLSGWTVVNQVGSDGTFFLQSGTASPSSGFPVPPPPAGVRAAMSDAQGPGSHVLYQDFVVPPVGGAAVLRFDLFVGNRDATGFHIPATAGLDFSTPQLNQQARVDILRAGADPFSVAPADVLQTLYRTLPGDPPVNGYFSVNADVRTLFAANAGQTLRLRFAEVDNVNSFQFGVDNVAFATPEPTAAVAFGVAAAVGLARLARRKLHATTPPHRRRIRRPHPPAPATHPGQGDTPAADAPVPHSHTTRAGAAPSSSVLPPASPEVHPMSSTRFVWVVALAAVPLAPAVCPAQVAGNQTDTFTSGTTASWSQGTNAPPTGLTVAPGGPGGASDNFLQLTATGGFGADSRLTMFNQAQWTGNYTSAGVTAVEMDLRAPTTDTQTLSMRVSFKAAGGGYSSAPFTLPADGNWHHATFPLNAANFSVVSGTTPFDALITGVTEMRILHSTTPSVTGDTIAAVVGVDNIHAVVSPVPEPGTTFAVGAGVLGLAAALRRGRRAGRVAGGVASAVLALFATPQTAPAQQTVRIDVFNFDFGTASTNTHVDPTIRVGDTIHWVWVTGFHSTTSAGGQSESWNSGDFSTPGTTFDHTFTNAGTFGYYCDIHGFDAGNGLGGGTMHGLVIVQPVPEPTGMLLAASAAAAGVVAVRRRARRGSVEAAASPPRRAGVTLIELLVVAAVLATIIGLLLPAVQRVRESANYTACRSNLRQIALAAHAHEAAHGYFPGPGVEPQQTSVLVPLLPYLERDPLRRRIADDRPLFLAIGDYVRIDPAQIDPARTPVPLFLCPSDARPAVADYLWSTLAGTNYVANGGTGGGTSFDFRYPTDGAAWYGSRLRTGDFTDGLSSTMLAAETLRGTGADSYSAATANRRQWMSVSCTVWPAADHAGTSPPLTDAACGMTMPGMVWRGDRGQAWIGGPGQHTLFNTHLMPNDPMSDCGTFGIGWYKASSGHPGGVNVVLADGSVHFIKNHVEMGVWRAISTRGKSEVIGSYCGCK